MCKRRSVVYLANWTWYEIARGVFATATNEGGAKFNFGPPLRGSVRSPHKKVKANLFWGALGQPLKKTTLGRLVQAANLEFKNICRPPRDTHVLQTGLQIRTACK